MNLQPGTTLNNRYRVDQMLGQGGFGAVYRAWDLNLKRACALKENKATTKEAQRQFEREAVLLANLSHSHLPRVTDHFIVPGRWQYLVMDYIEGQDLQEMITQTGGPLEEAQVLGWMGDVLSALEYLHTRTPAIIHRDIKPANIRITLQGEAVLVDFGIAKQFDPGSKTTLGARGFTPGYSPIEQYGQKSSATDTRTDIYALGATLYAALTGETPPESIGRVDRQAALSPRGINPRITMQTDRAIRRSMELLPDQRFQTVAEFRSTLLGDQGEGSPGAARNATSSQPSISGLGTQATFSRRETLRDQPLSPRYTGKTVRPASITPSRTLIDPQAVQAEKEFPFLSETKVHPLDGLIALARLEGQLTVPHLPSNWANYGEIMRAFGRKYGLAIKVLGPRFNTLEELAAIETSKEQMAAQAPDIIEIELPYTQTAKEKKLFAPYKVGDWDSIPQKDADGYWWAAYFGALAFQISKPAIENSPQDWEDLLKPEYRGKVSLPGDPLTSNEARMSILAPGLARAGNEIPSAVQAGLDFWQEIRASGNLNPKAANKDRSASGETPLVIRWDYLALQERDEIGGDRQVEVVIPENGVIADLYAGGISANARHANAARLWWEFLLSDAGQLLILESYLHPIRFFDMHSRGVIPEQMLSKLPPAESYQNATFLTLDELETANTLVAENWASLGLETLP